MINAIQKIFQKLFTVRGISDKYKVDYDQTVIAHNFRMLRIFPVVLLIISFFFLIQHFLGFAYSSLRFPDFRYVALFAFLFCFSLLYVLLLYHLKGIIMNLPLAVKKGLIAVFALVLYIWGIFLTLLDVMYTRDVASYIIVVMSIVILLRIRVFVSVVFLTVSAVAFLFLLSVLQLPDFSFISYITTTIIFTAIAGVISALLNNSFIENFLSRKTIEGQNGELVRLTNIDSLTGLYNRRFLFRELKKELKRAQRYGYHVCLMFIDIDNFKKVNDRYGHQVGDNVLMEVAGIIKGILRESDVVARYGGEEFVIASVNTPLHGGLVLAERIRYIVEEYSRNKMYCTITVSIGISEVSNMNIEEAIQKVDKLLYKAKENGRNRIEKG